MGLVQCFLLVMMSVQFVLTFPSAELDQYDTRRNCKICPAGEYLKSCTECKPCPAGGYTAEENQEDRCHRCYGDCRPVFHLKVVQNCTSKSDVKCMCEAGFTCTDMVSLSANCRYCEKIQETTAEATAIISDKGKHTPYSTSPGHSSTSAKPCLFPKCGPHSEAAAGNGTRLKTGVYEKNEKTSSQLAAILCPVIVMVCVALVILFFIHRPRNESCLKQAFALLVCSKGGRNASHKSKESAHQFTRDSFSAKQQPSSLSSANLGQVHVHNPGTVIFSLLSQFTSHVGTTIEGGKRDERGSAKEEDESDCPVCHPTSSPSIHLSEEERSGEIDTIFFPSQEQGKDCHVSKEEVL